MIRRRLSSPYEPHLYDGCWANQRCFIVGGGPSLKGFDFTRLKGELTIGINRAFEYFDPTIMFSIDPRVWTWYEQGEFGPEAQKKFMEYEHGYKAFALLPGLGATHDIEVVNRTGKGGSKWGRSLAEGVYHGGNSGFAAINLAAILGASQIYLLGFDMTSPGKFQAHFHTGYSELQSSKVYEDFNTYFERDMPLEMRRGRVVNLNPHSKLDVFPKMGQMPTKRNLPVVVSYATEGTPYVAEMENLRKSLKLYGLERDLQVVPNLGSWQANTQYKATFVKKMMDKYPHSPVLWVDCDAVFNRYPEGLIELCQNLDAFDVSATKKDDWELLGGTLLFSNTPHSKVLARTWVSECAENPKLWDQMCLQRCLEREANPYCWHQMDPRYCWIFDQQSRLDRAVDPVIEHFQASRRLKGSVNR